MSSRFRLPEWMPDLHMLIATAAGAVTVIGAVLAISIWVFGSNGGDDSRGGATDQMPSSTSDASPGTRRSSTPSQTSRATATLTLAPTQPPTVRPPVGAVLYKADWTKGPAGWQQAYGWSVLDGMLVSDGSGGDYSSDWISAPYQPGAADVNNYAIEAEVQVVRWPEFSQTGFGLALRSGFEAGVCRHGWGAATDATIKEINANCFEPLKASAIAPGTDWHLYRAEVVGNRIKFFVDGGLYAEVVDNRHLEGGSVGLWAGNFQVSVRSFKVIAL